MQILQEIFLISRSSEKIIEKISKKLGISKTEAVVRGIDLLINNKPKKYKSFAKSKTKNEFGTVYGNSDDD